MNPNEPGNDVTRPQVVRQTVASVEDTQPVRTLRAKPRRAWQRLLFIPVSILLMLCIAVGTGYAIGMDQRILARAELEDQAVQEQFALGIEDFLAARYGFAKQRFEYVLSLDPAHADAAELLARSLEALNQPTSTPVPLVTSTPTPTPDLRSFETIYQSAQEAFARGAWSATLDLLLIVRANDPALHLAEVNQMMATALRNRGMDKLFQGDLEQGLYDLALAERFGPLDSQAVNWRRSAAFYLTANSYFGLDWALAADFFGQMCVANIWGACYKYALSAGDYANELWASQEICRASFYYGEAFNYSGDAGIAPTATQAAEVCLTQLAPSPTVTPTGSGTPDSTGTVFPTVSPTITWTVGATRTATSTAGVATMTPTITPTPTHTSGATASPTPLPSPTSTATSP